jgi:hypothetical protein
VQFCKEDRCFNGGTCVEEFGNYTSCQCVHGYRGDQCTEDDPTELFCNEVECMNGGTCLELYGPDTECECVIGFRGLFCSEDDPAIRFCNESSNFCENGGTCNELYGTDTNCSCASGFTGDHCTEDDPSVSFCTDGTCTHGGTCQETFGDSVVCICMAGHTGERCEINLDLCGIDSCRNGGTCTDGSGLDFTCTCPGGFTGAFCEEDINTYCITNPPDCLNGGTCVEGYGVETSCECVRGFTGYNCTEDDPSQVFCMDTTCANGGTCEEGYGLATSCMCIRGYTGNSCAEDDPNELFCSSTSCNNGGTCNEEMGPTTSCFCVSGFNGPTCSEDDPNKTFCDESLCQNGGTCLEEFGPETSCSCAPGFTGTSCQEDNPNELFCDEPGNSCANGGTCIEGHGPETSCDCVRGYTGDTCSEDDASVTFCGEEENVCQNGGTCTEGFGPATDCMCPSGFEGTSCEVVESGACLSGGCGVGRFCNISCASDDYPTHYALLSARVTLTGESFIRVSDSLYPGFGSTRLSIFAYFQHTPGNAGYLFFYGSSENSRNLAIFLDGTKHIIWLFYTDRGGLTRKERVGIDVSDGLFHSLAVTTDTDVARFYVDGKTQGASVVLNNPDFTYGVNDDNPAVLYVGARPPRHFRFSGVIEHIFVIPDELLSLTEVEVYHNDTAGLVEPRGTCVNYLQLDEDCPPPEEPLSLLCSSVFGQCDPSLRCLPKIDGTYTCQPRPFECNTDEDCSSAYFCGSPLPRYGSNYYDHVGEVVSRGSTFLQQNTMELNGRTVVPLANTLHPQLTSDLTIFATVCQEPGNDGYVVGKGLNDRVRDFGLYLRSSKQTVWLAYGYSDNDDAGDDDNDSRFREILFFTDVLVADGSCHSVASVIDHSLNRAVLYIDGKAVGSKTLPSTPEFLPEFNTLYVGGRPSTGLFRFKGNISNLFVSTAPLSGDIIAALHEEAFEGSDLSTISLSNTVRYCYPYQKLDTDAACFVDTANFQDNNFRCQPPEQCVPVFDQSSVVSLPLRSEDPLVIRGKCVAPCSASCTEQDQDLQCGRNGLTYYNTCFRECANELLLDGSVGECPSYYQLYTSNNG